VKVEKRDGKPVNEILEDLHGLDPKAFRVKLYADGIIDDLRVRQEMSRLHPLEAPRIIWQR